MTKTMKYLSIAALVFVGALMTGCSNDSEDFINSNQPVLPSENVVTLTTTIGLEGDASTRALTEGGVKTFQAGDQIAVIYQNNEGDFAKAVATLAAGDITNNGKSARITVTLTNPKTDGTVKYVYPASMAKSDGSGEFWRLFEQQDGTLSKLAREFDFAKFEGTFNGTELPKGTLRNQLAICKFTIKDGDGNDITSNLTRLTIKNGTDVYYINTSSLDNIWVALKPITSGNINIYAAETWKLYKKTVTGNTTLAANTLTPITVTAPVVPGALSGLFTINESNDLVYFSWGNLQTKWENGSWDNWNFSDYQHEYVNKEIVKIYRPDNGEAIDLFGWSSDYSYNYYGINTYYRDKDIIDQDNDNWYTGDFRDWGIVNIRNGGGSNKWRTPSVSDLDNILFYRFCNSNVAGVVNARFMRVQLGAAGDKVKGVIIFPDYYVHPTLKNTTITADDINEGNTPGVILDWDDWAEMEKAGAVLLPCAGYREDESVTFKKNDYPIGVYWTSTGNDTWSGKCLEMEKIDAVSYNLDFKSYGRHHGYSVRLIGPGSANQ